MFNKNFISYGCRSFIVVNSHQLRFCYTSKTNFRYLMWTRKWNKEEEKKNFRKVESHFNKNTHTHIERKKRRRYFGRRKNVPHFLLFFSRLGVFMCMRMCTTSELFPCAFVGVCVCVSGWLNRTMNGKCISCLQTGGKVFLCLVGTFICCNFPSP